MTNVDYEVVVSKRRKTAAIQIKQGRVKVHVPPSTDKLWIHQFVSNQETWIKSKLVQQAKAEQEKYQLTEGSLFPILGNEKQLRVKPGNSYNILETATEIVIDIPPEDLDRQLAIKACLSFFLEQQAQNYMPEKCHELAEALNIRHRITNIGFKKTKSKWGHCTSDGRLQFNWLIMMAPRKIVDYLITHEVCHLIYGNHSKQYWGLVASLHPDFKESRKWLRLNGHKFWVF